MASKGALKIAHQDNVATLLEEAASGTEVPVRFGREVSQLKALEAIPFGFKIALDTIPKGGRVVKYGEPIGVASKDIKKGEMVHVHNIEGARGRGDLAKGGTR
jgi:altronate dehydratase small subunit